MAQDPENDEAEQAGSSVDPSHAFDMVPVYSSLAVDAEMEADVIHGVLESNGVPSMVVRATGLAPLGFEVQVPRARLEEHDYSAPQRGPAASLSRRQSRMRPDPRY